LNEGFSAPDENSPLPSLGTIVLNQQVKRNIGKFPDRYMFQLTKDEYDRLRSQNVTLKAQVSLSPYRPVSHLTSHIYSVGCGCHEINFYLYDNQANNHMKTELKRRDFISKCFKAGATGCALLYGNSLFSQDPMKLKKEDLKNLTYCCYKCTMECPTYKATIENNTELKKKVYEDAGWKEKYDIDFDPEKVFCFGCKQSDKPLSIKLTSCTVRLCAIEKGYECCIECKGLSACDKKLWKSYPEFKEKVIEVQKKYLNG
jgi:hypothetical protein